MRKKITNADLALNTHPEAGKKRALFNPQREQEYIKLRAEGWTRPEICAEWDKTHPKKSGAKWYEIDMKRYEDKHKARILELGNSDTSVTDAACREVMDTVNELKRVHSVLGEMLDTAKLKKKKKFQCENCRHWQTIDVFDSDKAVRISEAMIKTINTAERMSKQLPLEGGTSNSLSGAMDVKKFIDKMVDEGVLIVADKEKLQSFGI